MRFKNESSSIIQKEIVCFKIQTHKRLKRTLINGTKHNLQISRESPYKYYK